MKLILIMMFLFIAASLYADDYYARGKKVDVYATNSRKAKVIATLKKGDKVELISKKGGWIHVKIGDNLTGWAQKILMSNRPMGKKVSVLGADSKLKRKVNLSANARKRASGFTSAASARGLKGTIENKDGQVDEENYEALNQMESFHKNPEKESGMLPVEGE